MMCWTVSQRLRLELKRHRNFLFAMSMYRTTAPGPYPLLSGEKREKTFRIKTPLLICVGNNNLSHQVQWSTEYVPMEKMDLDFESTGVKRRCDAKFYGTQL